MLEINQKSLTVPLIQGGMGVGVSLGSLAGHVAKCGAMGVISTAHPGYKEDDFESNHRQANIRALKKEILKAQKLSQGKGLVAINAMVALKDYDELINAALESKVDAIISGAGLPLRLPELVKEIRNLKTLTNEWILIIDSEKWSEIRQMEIIEMIRYFRKKNIYQWNHWVKETTGNEMTRKERDRILNVMEAYYETVFRKEEMILRPYLIRVIQNEKRKCQAEGLWNWIGKIHTRLQVEETEVIYLKNHEFKYKKKELNTVYIGGGTPTTLEPDQLERLLSKLEERFDYSQLLEFTVEAGRPDSITLEKLQAIREFPVTRISVNPQTMNQETLDIIGRRHTVEQTKHAFHLARKAGFDNINMDLIVGLPGEDITKVQHTLDEVKALGPDSLTVHSLAVKRAARLNIFRDKYQEMTFENNQEIMDLTMKTAYEMGMGPYYLYRQKNMKGNFENVGYSEVDKAGIYNILIMEEKQPIIALGAGGSSKLVFDHGQRIERVENVKDVTNYIARIDEMIERKRTGIEKWL